LNYIFKGLVRITCWWCLHPV